MSKLITTYIIEDLECEEVQDLGEIILFQTKDKSVIFIVDSDNGDVRGSIQSPNGYEVEHNEG